MDENNNNNIVEEQVTPEADNGVTSAPVISADNDKVMAILSYFIFFLPALVAKDSKLAIFHANQSFILFVIGSILWIINIILSVTIVGLALVPFVMIVGLGVFVLWIIGIVNAANEKMTPLPLVGNLFTLFK